MKTERELNNIEEMLFFLRMALKRCRAYQDITDLKYDPDHEAVVCEYHYTMALDDKNREMTCTVDINVACDSNSAMIKDVITALDNIF